MYASATIRTKVSKDGRTATVSVPVSFLQRAGRKQILSPPGATPWSATPRLDSALLKAVVRAHRWREMLESGEYASSAELAKAQKINDSYLSRILRLTLIAPDIIEAILSGANPAPFSSTICSSHYQRHGSNSALSSLRRNSCSGGVGANPANLPDFRKQRPEGDFETPKRQTFVYPVLWNVCWRSGSGHSVRVSFRPSTDIELLFETLHSDFALNCSPSHTSRAASQCDSLPPGARTLQKALNLVC